MKHYNITYKTAINDLNRGAAGSNHHSVLR